MEDLAIHFKRFELDDNKCIYAPLNVIRGKYDEDANIFVTESGIVCDSIKVDGYDSDNYFHALTNIEELRKTYGSDIPDDTLITQFLDASKEQLYVGLCNGDGTVEIVKISDGELEEMFMQKSERKVVFTEKALKELEQCKDIQEVREKLSFVSKISNLTNDTTIYFNSDQDEESSYYEDIDVEEQEEEKEHQVIKLSRTDSNKFNYSKLYDIVLSQIIAQDEAVNKVVTRIIMNQIASDPNNKSHILIAGPTGTGKTEMVKIICKNLDIPYYRVNATDYTQEGYAGMDVSSMITGLINSTNGDIKRAEKGILIIDEIDKKSSNSNSHEVSNKAVLDSLLKITGKDIIQVEAGKGLSKDIIQFDTSNLTVIFLGAFEGIDEIVNPKSTIGFGKTTNKVQAKQKLKPKDFIKYGLTPELIGRIGCIVQTKPFTLNDYVKIIYKSKSSPLKLKKEMYEKDLNIKLFYTYYYVKEMAKKAVEINEGARGLNNAITETLEIIDQEIIKKSKKPKVLKLTKATAFDSKKYYAE